MCVRLCVCVSFSVCVSVSVSGSVSVCVSVCVRVSALPGLEPEIQKLISKHKQELQRLRLAHDGELQTSDARAAQRYVRQGEELRQQLERDKDEQCQREKETAKQRYGWGGHPRAGSAPTPRHHLTHRTPDLYTHKRNNNISLWVQ